MKRTDAPEQISELEEQPQQKKAKIEKLGPMLSRHQTIQDGDMVIIYLSDQDLRAIVVKAGETLHCKFGTFLHNSMIGAAFGTKVISTNLYQNKAGFIYLLKPNPRLWTLSLKHRTQILYHADISLIVSKLHLCPGKRVVEAGTGSGSLSHALASTIAPNGHLFTFEYHEQRYLEAQKEFQQHYGQHNALITITHRDVCEKGFTLDKMAAHSIDAIFLDLPKPWECVDHALMVLRADGGKLCTFSPCIEQVQKTCIQMSAKGFSDITTVEILVKDYQVQRQQFETLVPTAPSQKSTHVVYAHSEMRGHTGYLTFATLYKL